MILEEIMEEFYSVECANKPDISEERLQDPDLRKLYCSTLEKWQSEQIKFNRLRKELLMEWIRYYLLLIYQIFLFQVYHKNFWKEID